MVEESRISQRVIGNDLLMDLDPIFARFPLGKRFVLVCDDRTWVAAGEAIFSRHLQRYDIRPHSLGRDPDATMEDAEILIEAARSCDGLLAVGSGTVNDVAKYAAFVLGKPYICIATAPSMNGYTSATSSLETKGIKQSFPTAPPVAVVADLQLLSHAPRKMIRAGFGDTICRSTVEADMFMAHHLLGSPYPREAFECLRRHERNLLTNPIRLTESDPDYMRQLIDALLDAGDWMARLGSSAVASQGEHMLVHTAELMYGSELRNAPHGEMVAVATVAISYLQQKMLLGTPTVKSLPRDDAQFTRLFGKKTGPALAPIYARKVLSDAQVSEINARLPSIWPELKKELAAIMTHPHTLERAMLQANVPTKPQHIGLNEDRFHSALDYAYLTRDRFTFLDLALMSGKRITHDHGS